MNRVWGKAFVLAGLILILGGAPSWGGPPNNDVSDAAANTASGTGALFSNTFGTYNTAGGFYALFSNTFGDYNTTAGALALYSNQFGNANTATGTYALFSNIAGEHNTAIGFEALYSNNSGLSGGSNNTAVGSLALISNTQGSNNIAVGVGAGGGLTTGSNNIYLGSSAGTATESFTIRLGHSSHSIFIAGIGHPVSGSPVLINSAGQVGIQASSARYKHDIQPMGGHSRGLLRLRPVIFRYKEDAQGERQYGLIAEEVAQVYPELVTRGATGDVEAVRYHEVVPMLLNEVQHQQQQLAKQGQELAALKAQNARLRAAVVKQQERDAALEARLERLEAAAARAGTLASR